MDITVDGNRSRGLICLITNKVAANQIDATSRETDEGCEFLIETIWNRLESEDTLPKNHSSAIDAEDGVHVSRYVELFQRLNAGLWSIFHVLLCLFELLRKLYSGVSENDSLKVDKLSFFELHVDDWAGVTNDDYFSILVSLFYCDAGFCDWLIAGINSLSKSDNTILLGEVKGHFKLIDWAFLLVYLDDS